jgi:ribonuclease P protein component
MVPQKSRIPFKELRFRGYREAATPYFLVRVRRNALKKNRLGVVIGVSSVKSAARRNFWRRQIKSVFLAIPQKNFDFVVVLRPRAAFPSKRIFQKKLNEAMTSLISNS